MSSTATVLAATLLIVPLLLAPVVLRRRIRQRIDEQVRQAAADGPVAVPPVPTEHLAGAPLAVPAAPAPVLLAPGAIAPGPSVPGGTPPAPLSELLAGMTLPCELAPLTNVEPLPGSGDRLVFVTDAPAERVRADLKGAFAAVDFDLTWWAWNEGVAARDDAGFRVLVHPDPEAVTIGTRPAFPTAAPGTTVVELAAP